MSSEEEQAVTVQCYGGDPPNNFMARAERLDGELLAPDIRPVAEKQLVRMLDYRLLPAIILILLMNYIGDAAIASGRLKGLQQDLRLTDLQYDTVLAIIHASFVPAQIPSNMIINRISRPSYYLSVCVIVWGVTLALTGATKSYAGILTTRVFSGFAEAAFSPGGSFLLSRWYTRKASEISLRASLFFGGALISGAFGSFMAAGILEKMEGKLRVRAWRWLFYIQGAITVIIGILTAYLLPDSPHNTRWLSLAQRRLAQVRLAEDAGEADEDSGSDSALQGLLMALKDPKVAIFALMGCCLYVGLGFVNFFPTIVATLGFSTTNTLLLAAPPWVLSAVLGYLNAWHADRTGERYLHMTVPFWLVLLGCVLAASTMSIPGRYISMFLMAAGPSGVSLIMVWVANTVARPPAKRSAAIAIVNACSSVGSLLSSFIWKEEWAPEYRPSMYISIAALGSGLLLATIIRYMLAWKNKSFAREETRVLTKAEKERIEEAARLEGVSYEDALERRRGFRYLL